MMMTTTALDTSTHPRAHRRWLVPTVVVAAALAGVIALLAWPRSTPVPGGTLGQQWHDRYSGEPWADHVKVVQPLWPGVLAIRTDLGSVDAQTAVDICSAGLDGQFGDFSAVSVLGPEGAGTLAESRLGQTCSTRS